jgi:hypothetical protein
MTTKDAATPRRLNREEKRKLEKLLFADIEKAIGNTPQSVRWSTTT